MCRSQPNAATAAAAAVMHAGVTKKFNVPYIEGDIMSVGYTKQQCLHVVRGRSKLLEEVIKNMTLKQQELQVHLTSSRVEVSSFAEDAADATVMSNTSTVSYESSEFEHYSSVSDTKLVRTLMPQQRFVSPNHHSLDGQTATAEAAAAAAAVELRRPLLVSTCSNCGGR